MQNIINYEKKYEKTKAIIEQIRYEFIKKYPFFATSFLKLKLDIRENNLVATDGKFIYVPPLSEIIKIKNKLAGQNYDIKQFIEREIIIHEFLHNLLKHLKRIKDFSQIDDEYEKFLINIAGDIVIQYFSKLLGYDIPYFWKKFVKETIGFDIDFFDKKSFEEIYIILKKNIPKEKFKQMQQNQSNFSREFQKFIEYHSQNQEQEDNNKDNQKLSNDKEISSEDKGLSKQNDNQKSSSSSDDNDFSSLNYTELLQQIRTWGKIAGKLDILYQLFPELKPKISFEDLIKKINEKYSINFNDYTYLEQNEEFAQYDYIVPAYKSNDKYQDVLIILDTSSSISIKDLSYFVSEILSIYDLTRIKMIIETDTRIQKIYKDDELADFISMLENRKIQIKGRGGTDFKEVIDFINKNDEINENDTIFFFTDGKVEINFDSNKKNTNFFFIINNNNNNLLKNKENLLEKKYKLIVASDISDVEIYE